MGTTCPLISLYFWAATLLSKGSQVCGGKVCSATYKKLSGAHSALEHAWSTFH